MIGRLIDPLPFYMRPVQFENSRWWGQEIVNNVYEFVNGDADGKANEVTRRNCIMKTEIETWLMERNDPFSAESSAGRSD